MTAPPQRLSLDRVLDQAGEVFSLRGFDGTSFADLTAATGAKRSLLLYHFDTKEELWRRAMRRIVARFDACMAAHEAVPGDLPERAFVMERIANYIRTLDEVPEFGRILLREGAAPGPRLDWLMRNFVPQFAFSARLRDPAKDERLRATMLRGILLGAPLFATALAPLLETSIAAASRTRPEGVHPLSAARRDELASFLTDLVLS